MQTESIDLAEKNSRKTRMFRRDGKSSKLLIDSDGLPHVGQVSPSLTTTFSMLNDMLVTNINQHAAAFRLLDQMSHIVTSTMRIQIIQEVKS